MRSPFSYYGGKQKMAKNIVPLLPPHTTYVEPFAGGAAVLFQKPIRWSSCSKYLEALNDIDSDIVNVYRVFQDPILCRRLFRKLKLTPQAKEEFELSRTILADTNNKNPVDRAWAFIVNRMLSFGTVGTGFGRSTTTANGNGLRWINYKKILSSIHFRLEPCQIDCVDALKCIDIYDSNSTLFYVDPLYVGADQGGYKYSYTLEQFKLLKHKLENCRGSVVLSTYDVPGLDFSNWEKFTFKSNAKSRGKESNAKTANSRRAMISLASVRQEIVYRIDRSASMDLEHRKIWMAINNNK